MSLDKQTHFHEMSQDSKPRSSRCNSNLPHSTPKGVVHRATASSTFQMFHENWCTHCLRANVCRVVFTLTKRAYLSKINTFLHQSIGQCKSVPHPHWTDSWMICLIVVLPEIRMQERPILTLRQVENEAETRPRGNSCYSETLPSGVSPEP